MRLKPLKIGLIVMSLMLASLAFAQKVWIGVRPYHPPFEMQVNKAKDFSGFEVDLMLKVCQQLHLDCGFVALKFNDLFPALQSNKISLALGALIITPERQKEFLFTTSYMVSKGQFVVNQSLQVHQIADLCTQNIGIVKGSIYRQIVLDQCGQKVQIIPYPEAADAYAALTKEKIAAFITDAASAKYWIITNASLFKLVGPEIPIGQGYAMMANLDELDLIQKINVVIKALQQDGSYLQLYRTYFGSV